MKHIWVLILVVAVLGLVWRAHRKWFGSAHEAKAWSPSNRLEHLLLVASETEGNAELERELVDARVVAWIVADGKPMVFEFAISADAAADLVENDEPPDGEINFGPWLVCFSSQYAADLARADPVMGASLSTGELAEMSMRDMMSLATDMQTDLVLNPFVGVSRLFDQKELHRLLGH